MDTLKVSVFGGGLFFLDGPSKKGNVAGCITKSKSAA